MSITLLVLLLLSPLLVILAIILMSLFNKLQNLDFKILINCINVSSVMVVVYVIGFNFVLNNLVN